MGHLSVATEYLIILSAIVFFGMVLSFFHKKKETALDDAAKDPIAQVNKHIQSLKPLRPLTEKTEGELRKDQIVGKERYGNHYVLGSDLAIQCHLGYATNKHLLSIAPTRSGKGRGLVLPNLLDLPDHSVFVIDPKGENALVSAEYRRDQGHEIVIFNPYGIFADEFAARGFTQFQSFNPLANLNPHSPDFADDVATIAEALVYETGGDSHWMESARGLVEFLIMYLVTEPTERHRCTLRRLRSILAGGHSSGGNSGAKTELEKIIPFCEDEEAFELVRDNVGRYRMPTTEVHSIIATAETQTRIFKSPAICSALEGEAFDFRRMKNSKISVYLILPSQRLVTQARYLRLILLVAMSQFMQSEKGAHQVLMMLDEFANLGPLKVIENGYGLIAGHGVTLWSFVQNLTQLQNLYPKNWEVFIANSAAVTVSNVNDATTAEYFSKRAARQEVEKESFSSSHSLSPLQRGAGLNFGGNTSKSMVWDDTLPAANLYGASQDTIFVFMEGLAPPEQLKKIYYESEEPFKSRAGRNPMHKEAVAAREKTGGGRLLENLAAQAQGPRTRARGPWR